MSFRRRPDRPPPGSPYGQGGYAPPPYMAAGQAFAGNEHHVDMHHGDGQHHDSGVPGFYKSGSVSQAFGEDFRPDPNARPGTQRDMQNFVGALSLRACLPAAEVMAFCFGAQALVTLRVSECAVGVGVTRRLRCRGQPVL
jgi:hypothetical protein